MAEVPETPDPAAGRARALVAASIRAAAQDPVLAAQLAREALRSKELPETVARLHEALAELRSERPFRAHQETVTDAGFSPDGLRVVTAARDGSVRVWDVGGRPAESARPHHAAVRRAAFASPSTVLTCSADATAALWDVATGAVVVLRGHEGPVLTADWSASASRVLTVSVDGTARSWDPAGRELARIGGPDLVVVSARQVADGSRILALCADSAARLFDADGREVAVLRESSESVERAFPSPTGDRVLAAAHDGVARVWDRDGALLATLRGHTAPVLSADFSPSDGSVATASLDSTARIWDAHGGCVAVLTGHRASVWSVAYSGDGRRLLTVSSDSTARLWAGDGRAVAVLGGEGHPVALASWTQAGDLVATASRDHGTARVWDPDGRHVAALRGHGRRVVSLVPSPTGDRLVTVASDLTVRSWALRGESLLAEADAALPGELDDAERERLLAEAPADLPPLVDRDDPACATRQGPERGDFSEPEACAPCHRSQYDRWAASAHARTFEPANARNLPAAVVDGGTVSHDPGRTTFRSRGGRLLAETVGDDGEPHEVPLTHVAGRSRIRMFVTTLDDGRMQILPGMLEEPTGAWFDYTHLLFGGGQDPAAAPKVAPGDASFWTGGERSWTNRCTFCHSSGHESRHPGTDGGDPHSSWRALGVDCDSCHGPGRAHAEAWTRLETRTALPRLERLSVRDATSRCTVCHMEGDRVAKGLGIGEDLFEFLDPTLLDDPGRVDAAGRPVELMYDGLPFATSHCAGAGQLTCARCHDPHGNGNRSQLRLAAQDRALCSGCHEEHARDAVGHSHHAADGPGSRCVACHMPFLTVERGHGAVADHTLGIPYPGFEADRGDRDACSWCHSGGLGAPSGVVALSAHEVRTAYDTWWPLARGPRPWMLAVAAARRGEQGAGTGLLGVVADRELPRVVRASAARLLSGYAQEHRGELLAFSHDEDSLVRRSAVFALGGVDGEDVDARLLAALSDSSKAVREAAARAALRGWGRVRRNDELLRAVIPILETDVRTVPDDYRRWFRLGAARSLAGDLAGAIDAYEHQLALDPLAHAVRRQVVRLRERLRSK